MAAQRPKRNNSPINSKYQPLKATVPLSSLVRNTSPTRRRTSSSSPASATLNDKRNRGLLSPLGSKVNLFKPVNKTKAPKNIRRTNSLETLSSYINGQWPRENQSNPTSPPTSVVNTQYVINISTQTPLIWDEPYVNEENICISLDHRKTSSIGSAGSKEIFRECLKRTKQQSAQPYHGKQSPIQGDHSAVSSSFYTASKPVTIPQVPSSPKYPSLHTRRSVEGLNFELEGLELGDKEEHIFPRTPPQGRRPPIPKSVDIHTQTESTFSPQGNKDKRCQSLSPSWPVIPGENISPTKEPTTPNRCLSADYASILGNKGESPDVSLVPKYSSSPKPNNSFWFARGPPDGAEKVTLSVEDIESTVGCSSCPDTTKVTIQFSKDSPFCSLPAEYLCKSKKIT